MHGPVNAIRRRLLAAAVGGAAVPHVALGQPELTAAALQTAADPTQAASDETFWFAVASRYQLDSRHVVLNGGGNNPLPIAVVDALASYTRLAASQPRPHNTALLARIEELRRRLARLMGATPAELAITRNTTEGLNIVAWGLDLRAGDEVVLNQYEHHYAAVPFLARAARHGIVVRTLELPIEPEPQAVIRAYAEAITPRTRLLVASEIVDGWGFALPVRELSALAHRAGARMLVDGALSFGAVPVNVADLGCDFYATSLHKWLNAPLGTGALYVRRSAIEAVAPLISSKRETSDIRKFEDIGTRCGATIAAIGQAIDLYEAIGPTRKAARLGHLLTILRKDIEGHEGIVVWTERHTSLAPTLARIALRGADGRALMMALAAEGFFTYGGFDDGHDGIYVAPNVFNTPDQMRRLGAILRRLASEGVPPIARSSA